MDAPLLVFSPRGSRGNSAAGHNLILAAVLFVGSMITAVRLISAVIVGSTAPAVGIVLVLCLVLLLWTTCHFLLCTPLQRELEMEEQTWLNWAKANDLDSRKILTLVRSTRVIRVTDSISNVCDYLR